MQGSSSAVSPSIPIGKRRIRILGLRDGLGHSHTHNFRLGGSLGPRLIFNNSAAVSYHTGHLKHSDSSHYDYSHYCPADLNGNHDEGNELESLDIPSTKCTIRIASAAYGNRIVECKWIAEYHTRDFVVTYCTECRQWE